VVNLYSPNKTYDAVYLSNYATINLIDALARIKGVGQATLFGAARLFAAHLARPGPADRTQPDAERCHRVSAEPECSSGVGPSGRCAGHQRAAGADQYQDDGAADTTGGVRRHCPARQSRWLRHPCQGRCPRGAQRKNAGPLQPLQRCPRVRDRHLPDSGIECGRGGAPGPRDDERAGEALPPPILLTTSSGTPRFSSRPRSTKSSIRWPSPSCSWPWWYSCSSGAGERR